MNFLEKIKLMQDFDSIFTIKIGKFIHHENKCYKVPKLLAGIFKFYYYSGLPFLIIFFIFLLSPHIINNLLIQFAQSVILYMIFEITMFMLFPLINIPCWEENIKYK